MAVKVLFTNRDPQFAARFKREARAIAALQHHNILPIYDYGEQDGLLYLVLQYIENGTTLGDMLGKPMAPGHRAAADRPRARRARLCPQARRDPPRYQARQCADALAELADAGRFRHRQADERQPAAPDHGRPDHRHGRVYGARAGHRPADRRAHRSVCRRRGAVRDGDRPRAVRRRHAHGGADQARLRAAAAAAHAQPRSARGWSRRCCCARWRRIPTRATRPPPRWRPS